MEESWYVYGVWIVGILVFLGVWIYSLFTWGLLVGLLIGWLPALIAGVVCGLLWPIVLLSLIAVAALIFY